jgi:hypothetical protein
MKGDQRLVRFDERGMHYAAVIHMSRASLLQANTTHKVSLDVYRGVKSFGRNQMIRHFEIGLTFWNPVFCYRRDPLGSLLIENYA